ncbi:hypothetical protein [Aliarcobacter butzleri]|uniref:hypothetical protein n=1 Tax=Aliarcobacter butzleri TaxID=28197 RepID=UPI0021B350F1|nr:hypothetical protein [Aliarcobacter butzleri]MCT7553647.1 hypothetical protein [Aliarcobacter butzleri]
MKNYIFYTQEGFTYDKSHNLTHNIQLLGNGKGNAIDEAFKNFKDEQSYLLHQDYDKVIAVQIVSSSIMNLRLKGDK